MLLALAGGAVGMLFAFWTLEGIRALGAASVPRIREIGIDVPVLLFTLVLSAAAGMLFGLAPAWRLSGGDLTLALSSTGRAAAGASALWGRGNRLRRLLTLFAALALALGLAALGV